MVAVKWLNDHWEILKVRFIVLNDTKPNGYSRLDMTVMTVKRIVDENDDLLGKFSKLEDEAEYMEIDATESEVTPERFRTKAGIKFGSLFKGTHPHRLTMGPKRL